MGIFLFGRLVGTSGFEPPTSRLSGVRSNHLSYAPISSGGDEEDRTPDPLRARQVLSQLSYTPIFFEGCALKIEQHPLPSPCTDQSNGLSHFSLERR